MFGGSVEQHRGRGHGNADERFGFGVGNISFGFSNIGIGNSSFSFGNGNGNGVGFGGRHVIWAFCWVGVEHGWFICSGPLAATVSVHGVCTEEVAGN